MTRRKKLEAANRQIKMPDLGAGEYLIEAWEHAGRYQEDADFGVVALSWQEVNAFCLGHPIITEHWERHLIYDMSQAYVRGLRHGADPFAMSPMDIFEERLDGVVQ